MTSFSKVDIMPKWSGTMWNVIASDYIYLTVNYLTAVLHMVFRIDGRICKSDIVIIQLWQLVTMTNMTRFCISPLHRVCRTLKQRKNQKVYFFMHTLNLDFRKERSWVSEMTTVQVYLWSRTWSRVMSTAIVTQIPEHWPDLFAIMKPSLLVTQVLHISYLQNYVYFEQLIIKDRLPFKQKYA